MAVILSAAKDLAAPAWLGLSGLYRLTVTPERSEGSRCPIYLHYWAWYHGIHLTKKPANGMFFIEKEKIQNYIEQK